MYDIWVLGLVLVSVSSGVGPGPGPGTLPWPDDDDSCARAQHMSSTNGLQNLYQNKTYVHYYVGNVIDSYYICYVP